MNRHLGLFACWIVLGASPLGSARGETPTFPPGKNFSAPKPMVKPQTLRSPWKVVIARDNLPLHLSYTGDDTIKGTATKFGEVAYIVDVYKDVSKDRAQPARMLLAKFDDSGTKFQGWFGWVDGNFLMWDGFPLKVKQARDMLLEAVPRTHPFYKRIPETLPDSSREDYGQVTLKAVTHPERGKACFTYPVPPAEYETRSKTDEALPLQPFAFFYVYKVAVESNNVYCLLGPRSTVPLESGELGDRFRQRIVGWVEVDSLILWTTREAFEYHLEKPPLDARRRGNAPIELFAKKEDLVDWADWARSGRKGKNPAKPIYTEELDEAKAPEWMKKPWNLLWMRYPILSSYPLEGRGGKQGETSWLGYQLCILGSTKSGGSAADLEAMKKRLNDAVKDMRVYELVIVLDTTFSMDAVFEPLKNAVIEVVEDLKARAGSEKDELEKIQLRVAVVLYKDFEKQDSEFLTKSTDDFFDVMTPSGLNEFKDWLSGVKAKGGGDQLEEPFEGIDEAIRKFLSVDGSKHSAGAARVVMVIGDSGNHEKDGAEAQIGTKLSFDDILQRLVPVGRDSIGKQKKELAEIQLHSVMCYLNEEDPKKERIGLKKWEDQIHELARKTGGTYHEVGFQDEDARKQATSAMIDALNTALEARRALTRRELDNIRGSFGGGTAGGGGGGAGFVDAPAMVIAKDRLKEIIKGEGEVDRLMKGLSQAFFTQVHTVEQDLNEPEQLARLKLCVLMSQPEFLNFYTATQRLAVGLDDELVKGGLEGAGDKIEARIKELVIRCVLAAFGDDATPARMQELKDKTISDIQKEVNKLPVQFGVLKKLPETEEELRTMIKKLNIKAGLLLEINGAKRAQRFFPAGVATGEEHVWLHKEELP